MRFLSCAVAALVLALPACGGSSETGRKTPAGGGEHPVRGGTIIRHLENDCKTLNWVLFNTSYENYVLRYLYDYLLDYDENFHVRPVLAERYEVGDDHLRIRVVLRDSLYWHDGVPITAEDVKFTVDKIRDPAVLAVNKEGWFSKLDKVRVIDDRTMEFVWREPYAPAIHALTQLAPIPKHVYDTGDFSDNPANRAPVGSGAYKFEEWRTSQSITLVRNDNYWGPKAYADRVVFRVIPDRSVALNALRAGELDESRLRQSLWEQASNDDAFRRRFNMNYYPVPQYNYLAWNCRSIWFKDTRVRKAMTMLFDRETVISKIYSGYAQPISGPFYVNSPAYDPTVKPLPYDPAAASALLDEAGWKDTDGDGVRDKDGMEFEFEFYVTSGSHIAQSFAQLLQESCKKVGIIVKIRKLEGATFFDKVFKGQYDAAALAWNLDNDPDIYDTFHSSQVPPIGLNHTFYSNAAVDSLLELGRVEFDIGKRMQIYHQVHRLIHDDPPYTFVNTVPEKRPINKRIGNVVISPGGPFDFYPGAIYWYIKNNAVEARN